MVTDPVTQMQAMLARVRPVGMTDSAAREWLGVAVGDVRHLPPNVLAAACSEAKRTVQFHTAIVSSILSSEAVKSHERHQREVGRLIADGHVIPSYNAPAIEDRRGGAKQIGSVKALEDYRG